MAFLTTGFPTPPEIFCSSGMAIASSTSSWSRNGTRASMALAIVSLSTRISRSSGSRSRRSW